LAGTQVDKTAAVLKVQQFLFCGINIYMFTNYWLVRAMTVYENEVVLVNDSPNTKNWFDKMSQTIPVIAPSAKPAIPEDFEPTIGLAHHLRLTKWGIEGVLKIPRKYHRWQRYVIYDTKNQPKQPFWVILYK
jgi:hypothetical protein